MTPGNQADQDVGVGEVFAEVTEKKQFPGPWFFRRGEIGAWGGQKIARGEKVPRTCTMGEHQKVGGL